MDLTVAVLLQQLQSLNCPLKLAVAYSGGLDSHVLLHLAAGLPDEFSVRALHVNHGLQTQAWAWSLHCAQIAKSLKLPYLALEVAVAHGAGQGVEAAARKARYQAFAKVLDADEVLLLAHHQADQAETVLYNLIRGSGPAGLAAMPKVKSLGTSMMLRPLLDTPKAAIIEYAKEQKLNFIDDPSNQDVNFDRNFLRHEVLPLLSKRFAHAHAGMARAAQLCQESESLTTSYMVVLYKELFAEPNKVWAKDLQALSPPKLNAILRFWLAKVIGQKPSYKLLQEIKTTLLAAAPDRRPQIKLTQTKRLVKIKGFVLVEDTNAHG